jgi:hypothetical protein
MTMKRTVSFLILISLVFLFSGCAAIFKGNHSKVVATSQPEGAEVYINGYFYGTTPVKLKLRSKENYVVEFRKEGFKTQTRHIHSNVGAGWIVLDVIFGLIPVIVDAATGSWYHLDQTHVNAELRRQNP